MNEESKKALAVLEKIMHKHEFDMELKLCSAIRSMKIANKYRELEDYKLVQLRLDEIDKCIAIIENEVRLLKYTVMYFANEFDELESICGGYEMMLDSLLLMLKKRDSTYRYIFNFNKFC